MYNMRMILDKATSSRSSSSSRAQLVFVWFNEDLGLHVRLEFKNTENNDLEALMRQLGVAYIGDTIDVAVETGERQTSLADHGGMRDA